MNYKKLILKASTQILSTINTSFNKTTHNGGGTRISIHELHQLGTWLVIHSPPSWWFWHMFLNFFRSSIPDLLQNRLFFTHRNLRELIHGEFHRGYDYLCGPGTTINFGGPCVRGRVKSRVIFKQSSPVFVDVFNHDDGKLINSLSFSTLFSTNRKYPQSCDAWE